MKLLAFETATEACSVALYLDGEVLVKVLHRQTARIVELHSLNAEHAPRTIEVKDIEGMGRIVWASQ